MTVIVLTFMRRLITQNDLSYCFCCIVECSKFCKSDFISKNELRIKSLECNGREIWITFDHTSNLLHQPWPKHVSMLPLGMNVLKWCLMKYVKLFNSCNIEIEIFKDTYDEYGYQTIVSNYCNTTGSNNFIKIYCSRYLNAFNRHYYLLILIAMLVRISSFYMPSSSKESLKRTSFTFE